MINIKGQERKPDKHGVFRLNMPCYPGQYAVLPGPKCRVTRAILPSYPVGQGKKMPSYPVGARLNMPSYPVVPDSNMPCYPVGLETITDCP